MTNTIPAETKSRKARGANRPKAVILEEKRVEFLASAERWEEKAKEARESAAQMEKAIASLATEGKAKFLEKQAKLEAQMKALEAEKKALGIK
jgi:hypothetical protein